MADKKKASSEKTVVTRIKATDTAPQASKKPSDTTNKKAAAIAKAERISATEQPSKNPFVSLGRYFKGAWQELMQVRWPTRSATWSMTGAVLAFTAVFSALILLLDAGFQLLFDLILK